MAVHGAVIAPSPQIEVLRLADGLIVQQGLYVAARLGIADLLGDRERSASELAAALGVNEGALYRLLRFLAGLLIFEECEDRSFKNSERSQYLRSDCTGSVRPVLMYRGGSSYFTLLGQLGRCIETGRPLREASTGVNSFEFLRRHPEEGKLFDAAMAAISEVWAPAIAASYDFGQWGSLMDVGGGNGTLVTNILASHPTLRAVLADEPHVLARAAERQYLSHEITARLRFEPIDFFKSVPRGCRAYLMKNVIHDWDDEQAHQILSNCRRAVPEDGALLIVEYSLGAQNRSCFGKSVDLMMLALTGGKERSVAEHERLLASAAFAIRQVVSVADEIMLLEAIPV